MHVVDFNEQLVLVTAQSTVALVVAYYGVQVYMSLKAKSQSDRQKSWVLTAISSAVMTTISLPYLWQWFHTGEVIDGGVSADKYCCFFIAYLLSDLILGSIHYRGQISIVTGWVHHTVYILLLTFIVIPGSLASLFSMCCILELPTFLLAIGSLNKALRSDYLFAGVFFLTRIALHVYIAVVYALRALSPEGGSWLPTALLTLVFPMHAMWMINCVQGILRRRKLAKVAKAAAAPISTTGTAGSISAEAIRIRDLHAFILSRSRRAALRSATLLRRSRQHVLRLLQDALEEQQQQQQDTQTGVATPAESQHFVAGNPTRWRSIRRRVVGRIARSLPEGYGAYASGPLPAIVAASDMVEHAHRDN